MSPGRGLRLDLFAFAFFLAGLAVALSVFSYEPAAPVDPAVTNLLGAVGADLARELFDSLGLSVYVLLMAWFVLVVLLLIRRRWPTWGLRLVGWLILLPAVTVAPECLGGIDGMGGKLGNWLSDWLQENFEPLVQTILVGGVSLTGLLLALDFLLLRTGRLLIFVIRRTISLLRRARRVPRPEQANAPEPATEPPVEPKLADEPAKDSVIPIRHSLGLPADGAVPKTAAEIATVPINRPGAAPESERFADYKLPPLTLLQDPEPFPYQEHDQKLREQAALLEKTFADFKFNVKVVGINTGPVITQYEVALETGLRVHKVTGLADDIALNLKVPSVRMVAPIPGKNTVGVEIPNDHRATVRLKEVVLAAGKKIAKTRVPLFLGKDTEGRPLVQDLAEMPHLLIAGQTGTGKSVCMNAIILSILMTRRPDEVKMIMIDPKMLELSEYGRVPHLMHPVVKDMKKAEAILAWAVDKMEERYDLLSRVRVRSIAGYNELTPEVIHQRLGEGEAIDEEFKKQVPDKMPYIIIFVDELADLMMTMKKEVEGHIIRLAQKSRAAGIHLVVATQKPTVDIITGLIKSNLPSRICFKVSSRTDSRVVLDEMGADKLLGRGDMLFLPPGTSTLLRAQGTFSSDEEISRVIKHLECEPCWSQELIQLKTSKEGAGLLEGLKARDDLYEQAIEVVVREGRGSVSLLQRALGIGYGRAARLIDFMAEDGIVGTYNGSQARDVLYSPEAWEQLKQGGRLAS